MYIVCIVLNIKIMLLFQRLRTTAARVLSTARYVLGQAKTKISERLERAKAFHPILNYLISGAEKGLDVFFSSSTSNICTTLAVVSMLASPIGPAFGAVMCAIGGAGLVAGMIFKTYRVRKVQDFKHGQACLDDIKHLNDKIQEAEQSFDPGMQDKLSACVQSAIRECKSASTLQEPVVKPGVFAKLARIAKYFNISSAQSATLAIINAALSANPISIGYSILSFITSGCSTANAEATYQAEKAKFLQNLAKEQRDIAPSLGIEHSRITAKTQLSVPDLLRIMNIKEAEHYVATQIQRGEFVESDIEEAFHMKLRELTKSSALAQSERHSFIRDMGSIFIHGFSTAEETRTMTFSTLRERAESKESEQMIEMKRTEVSRNPTRDQMVEKPPIAAMPAPAPAPKPALADDRISPDIPNLARSPREMQSGGPTLERIMKSRTFSTSESISSSR